MQTQQVQYTRPPHYIFFVFESLIKRYWYFLFWLYFLLNFLMFFHQMSKVKFIIILSQQQILNISFRLQQIPLMVISYCLKINLINCLFQKDQQKQNLLNLINNKIQLLLLMKKYQRVNLTSDIYKEKSRSKSPFNSKFMESLQHDSQRKKYQNVCCPNCKYLFKIPKQNQQPKSPSNVTSSSRYIGDKNPFKQSTNTFQKLNSNKIDKKSIQVQTEQYLLGSLKSSPKRQIIKLDDAHKRYAVTDRTPERQLLMSFHNDQFGKKSALTDRHRQQQKMSALKNKSRQKISVSPKNKVSKQLFPARSAYMNEGNFNKKQKISDPMKSRYIAKSQKQQNNQNKMQTNQITLNKLNQNINNELANQLLKKVHLSEQINEIIQYQMSLPPEISVPSYCKMLMYEMQEKKEIEQKKQKEKSILLDVKQISYQQDYLPRFNGKNDKGISRQLFNNQ